MKLKPIYSLLILVVISSCKENTTESGETQQVKVIKNELTGDTLITLPKTILFDNYTLFLTDAGGKK